LKVYTFRDTLNKELGMIAPPKGARNKGIK
jgi:hypothetical protein